MTFISEFYSTWAFKVPPLGNHQKFQQNWFIWRWGGLVYCPVILKWHLFSWFCIRQCFMITTTFYQRQKEKKIVQLESSVEQSKACVPFIQSFTGIETFAVPFKCFLSNGRSASSILIYWIAHNNCIDLALCHRSNFNPCCVVYKILFLKPSYVSLMCKCRLVLINKYRGLY